MREFNITKPLLQRGSIIQYFRRFFQVSTRQVNTDPSHRAIIKNDQVVGYVNFINGRAIGYFI